jgi:hypothetical protein
VQQPLIALPPSTPLQPFDLGTFHFCPYKDVMGAIVRFVSNLFSLFITQIAMAADMPLTPHISSIRRNVGIGVPLFAFAGVYQSNKF